MSSTTMQLLARHDGHKVKAKGYHTANNDLVKYGFWVVIGIVLASIAAYRLTTRPRRWATHKSTNVTYIQVDGDDDDTVNHQNTHVSQHKLATISHSVTARYRQLSYPRPGFANRLRQYWSPPSRGECLFLFLYWAVLLAGLFTDVIFESESELYSIQWEVVGFRGAWVSTMQLPLLYATGCRINIISLTTGVSHERLNWFHRWIARTVFMTLIIHWATFYREWDLANFVQEEIKLMPMVIWGFAAWAAIGLMVITGFGWFRDWSFEIWLVSHIGLAWAILALSYTHTHCTTYFVGASLGMLVFDIVGRVFLSLVSNTRVTGAAAGIAKLGHTARIERLDDSYLRLTIQSPQLCWRAGQHIYLTVPQIQPFQSHPFTIIGSRHIGQDDKDCGMSFIIKAHLGFTKELHESASSSTSNRTRVFIQGPYGNPPLFKHKNSVILISTGNRASYTLSLLQDLSNDPGDTREVVVHLIFAELAHFNWYKDLLEHCLTAFGSSKVNVRITVHITRARSETFLKEAENFEVSDAFVIGRDSAESVRSQDSSRSLIDSAEVEKDLEMAELNSPSSPSSSTTLNDHENKYGLTIDPEKHADEDDKTNLLPGDGTQRPSSARNNLSSTHEADQWNISYGRPIADLLLRPVAMEAKPHSSIMVVAAVPQVLAANISKTTTQLIKSGIQNEHSASDIELWIEENGS